MNMLLGLALVSFATATRGSAEDVVWVTELEDAPVGREIVVEGRFQGRFGTALDQIRLKNVNQDRIEFRLDPDVDRKFPSNLQFIRINGVATKSAGKLVVRVKSWSRITTTDEDRFRSVAAGIGKFDHVGWYALATRMQRLAEFYGERELKDLAATARVSGFRAEEAAVTKPQTAELLKLADRAADFGLDTNESRRMRHKALRWRFDTIENAQGGSRNWAELADSIAKLLPGSDKLLTAADAAIVTQYRAKPIEFYDDLPKARDACDRDLWVEVTARGLLAHANEPDADVANLASVAAKRIPERPEVARKLLRQWADVEAARVNSGMPAGQVRRIAQVYRAELDDPKRSDEILRTWLDSRRRKLGPKDADGRVRLAKDIRSDLKDDETAAKLLLEAVQIEAELPDAAAELKSLGYSKTASGWKRGASESNDADPTVRPVKSRLPERNMTPQQVRELMGDPKSSDRLRYAYRRNGRVEVIEQWLYRGPPDLLIVFHVLSESESRVIAINTPSQK